MSDTNEIWAPREPTDPEYTFQGWLNWENKFGEFGTPGYHDVEEFLKIPGVFGDDTPRKVYFQLYRQEGDGLLLSMYARWENDEGLRQPLLMLVHPDHRGKGIATQVLLRSEEHFMDQRAAFYGYTPEEFRALPRAQRASEVIPVHLDVSVNEAGAGLAKHMVNIFYTVEKDFTQGE
jgi:GNAT superfamily N-acetyltransferase